MTGTGSSRSSSQSAPTAAKSEGIYTISVAAELAGMHAQTLRQYDRLGLVSPSRTQGRGRRYTSENIRQLRDVQYLSQEEGINLAGVRLVMELRAELDVLRNELASLEESVRSATAEKGRVFAADASGRVRQRPYVDPSRRPQQKAGGDPSLDGTGGLAIIPARTGTLIPSTTMIGWLRLASLHLERRLGSHRSHHSRLTSTGGLSRR